MTSSLKKFRMQTFKEVGVDSDEELEDNSASSIKKRHKREIERAERENRENTSALLELRDMEDELKTLQRLFDTQTAMIGKMLEIYTGDSLKELTYNGQSYLNEALNRLAEYKTQTSEMLDRVAATRGDVSTFPSPLTNHPASIQAPSLTPRSTRNSSRWPSAKPRSTTSAGPVSRQSLPAPRTSRS